MRMMCRSRRGVLVVPVAGVVVVVIPPYVDKLAICASIGLAGRGLSMISMRSDIAAAAMAHRMEP
jgi:hypothetical protein